MNPNGRPSSFTEPLADEICSRIENGETLRKICRDDHMPDRRTVNEWSKARPEFHRTLTQAREACSWHWAEEGLEIADEVANGPTQADVAAANLRLRTRQWLAAVVNPREFSPRQRQELSGPEGKPLQEITPELEAKLARIAEMRAELKAPRGCS